MPVRKADQQRMNSVFDRARAAGLKLVARTHEGMDDYLLEEGLRRTLARRSGKVTWTPAELRELERV